MNVECSNTRHTLLIDRTAFRSLQTLQRSAPQPRLDLRYWVEGMLLYLEVRTNLRSTWIRFSREALQAALTLEVEAPAASDSNCSRTTMTDGVPCGTVEGASARTLDHASSARVDHCKALQIGGSFFASLKVVQAESRPRLEMRYLVEGAARLLLSDQSTWPDLVICARQSLARHMFVLLDEPVQPFPLEIER